MNEEGVLSEERGERGRGLGGRNRVNEEWALREERGERGVRLVVVVGVGERRVNAEDLASAGRCIDSSRSPSCLMSICNHM